mgnify:CR=1 FL=1
MASASSSAAYINPMEALGVLPDSLSIADVQTYLKATIRRTTTVLRNSSVKVNLLRFKSLKTTVALHEEQSRKVKVDASTRCPICKDNIYADQVISVFPDDTIYHLACSSQRKKQGPTSRNGNPF